MPTFPTYPGELPSCLNPLSLRHYFLLAYWVFFRPTALKCYLYQADPDLSRSGPGLGVFRTLRVSAYRNLYMVALGATLGVTALLGAPIVLLASSIQGTAPNWAGVAYGVAGGVVFGVAFGANKGVAAGVALGVALGVTLGVDYGVALGVDYGVGALRLPMYLIQGGGLVRSTRQGQHPIWWDELAVLPFLQTQVAINQAWQQGAMAGLERLSQLAENPFQRWVLQRALYQRLHQSSSALPFLYQLFSLESLEAYAIAPVRESDWQGIPSVRQVFISELAGRGNDDHAREPEGAVWWLTRPLRIRKSTTLTAFADLLYRLTWGIEPDAPWPLI
ncbi:MAG: hypothetical protein ACFCVB_20565 [Nodosilinea sp.]